MKTPTCPADSLAVIRALAEGRFRRALRPAATAPAPAPEPARLRIAERWPSIPQERPPRERHTDQPRRKNGETRALILKHLSRRTPRTWHEVQAMIPGEKGLSIRTTLQAMVRDGEAVTGKRIPVKHGWRHTYLKAPSR